LFGASGCARLTVRIAPERTYQRSWLTLKRGDLPAAAAEADVGLQSFPSINSDWHWRFSTLKAEILLRQGLTTEALALDAPDLPASLRTSDLAVWRKLTQGAAAAYLLQFAQAARDLGEAAADTRDHHPELLGEVALRKGTLASLQDDVHGAESEYRETLRLAREQKDPFLETAALGSLGVIATKEEHYDQALDWNRAALRLSTAIDARSSSARIVGNMAWSYRELGDFDSALASYQQAEEASMRSGAIGNQIYWLTGIASIYSHQHDYAAAESTSTQALALARGINASQTIIECLNDLSHIALETNRVDSAEERNKEARAREASAPDPIEVLDSTLIEGRIQDVRREFTAAQKSFQQVIQDPKAKSSQKWEAEARLARLYAEQGQNSTAEKEFRRSLETVEQVRASVQGEDLRLSFLSTAISFYDDYIEFLLSRHRPDDALQVAELSRARTLAEGLGTATKISLPLPNFHPQEIARRTKAILLFYWMGQKASHLWVITPSKISYVAVGSAAGIDPLVKSYREAVLSGRDVLAGGSSEGERLYELLIEPAKKLIPPGSRVILLPDGSLYGLNFETLLVPGPKPHFWIEDVTLTTASSLTLLSPGKNGTTNNDSIGRSVGVRQARGVHPRYVGAAFGTEHHDPAGAFRDGNLLLVGDAAPAAAEFPVLRQARAEMAQVGHYFPESRRAVLAGPQATPSKFLASGPERFAYLHFVTHGSASRAHPLDSAVILSPDGDSFKLYARDIVKHPLSAYLVTISACSGSGTRAYSGEGLVGLSWAFLRAGAHNVIAALWEVSDASTPQLMDRLYGELSQGQDPASALRTAKLSLLKSDSVFKKPFYWAPFQLYSGS